MNYKLFIYIISLLLATFAVSGINIEVIIRKNRVWEARFLTIMLIFGLAYIFAAFFTNFLDLI